ncbi:hypothetical protein SH1V18_10090 [Vallitalea longa]|uniref:DUF4190 domain-containing protein n=1 Tax=Vallitalea longa TaxID=2936439 RepID=A0A9W5Y8M0_9FIRM|nr:DUF4190 domain-containing protein [Vallitalea longa]GKX28529.1 hypothetical protein SH1V18_10090 [Vallitalea longa]
MSDFNNSDQNQEAKYKGFAVASMVCGIVGIVFFCVWYISIILAILAIIFGAIVINDNKKKQTNTGKGMAIAGLVLGIITVGLAILCIAGALTFMSSLESYM